MKKITKILLCTVSALILCAASLFIGYNFGEESNKNDVIDAEHVYLVQMKAELTSLSELLSAYKILRDKDQELYSLRSEYRKLDVDSDEYKEKVDAIEQLSKELISMNNLYNDFGKEYIQSVLSSLHDVRIFAENATEYTNDEEMLEQTKNFAVAVHVLENLIEYGITVDDTSYASFLSYSYLNNGRTLFLKQMGDAFDLVLKSIDKRFIDYTAVSKKYSPSTINETLSDAHTGRTSAVSIEGVPINGTIEMPNNYKPNSMVHYPSLYIYCNDKKVKADFTTTGWEKLLDYGGYINEYILLSHDFSLTKTKYINAEINYYSSNLIGIQFDFEPQEYTVYELQSTGTLKEVEYDLSERCSIKMSDAPKYYYVKAKWAQGNIDFAFKVNFIKPIDWSDYEKNN